MRNVNVDFERMAKETGIGVVEIMEVFDIPLSENCEVLTIEEAAEAYRRALVGSSMEKAVLEKWNKLSLEEIKKASTIKEVKKAYGRTLGGSNAMKAALEKWNELSIEEVKRALTVKEVVEVYENSSYGSEASKTAIRKLATFFPLLLDSVSTET